MSRSAPATRTPAPTSSAPARSVRATLARLGPPWAVLIFALFVTALTTWAVDSSGRARDRVRFERDALAARQRVSARLDVYVALLRGTAGMLAIHPDITREEFANFVGRLDLTHHYPGIQGIGLSLHVTPDEIPVLQARLRADGEPDFTVHPDTPRTDYHVIAFIEPLDRRNRAALGYDMFTNPVRRAAMERARDGGEAAMSGRVLLVQEIDSRRQAGFLIYVPVYRGGGIPADVASRRAQLSGYAYAAFRVEDFLAGVFGPADGPPEVELQIFDGDRADPAALLHDLRTRGLQLPLRVRTMADTLPLDVAGHRWTIVATPSPAFAAGLRESLAPVVLCAGLLLSAALFGLARAHRAAEDARRDAELANRAKSEFLAAMSHELRTPLNAIGGYAELMELGIHGPVTDAQRQALSRIQRSQQHLTSLINDVLNFAKLEAGRVEYDIEDVRLDQLAEEVMPMVEPQLRQKGLEWAVRVPEGLVARADREKVRQILLNLLSNAAKFTECGEIVLDAPPCDRARMVCIRVTDTGIGIAPDKQEAMFDPFVQVHRRLTRPVEGTGLGLAISRDLARAMGGDLGVESEEGKGAAFTLTLPAA